MRFFSRTLLAALLLVGCSGAFAAKLTDQPTLTIPVASDILHVVDVSDTTSDPAGTSKQATLANLGSLFLANTSVLVNVLTDLPAPVTGVITLAANTNYTLGDDVSLGTNRIDASAGNISWTSDNIFGPTLTYTGTGTMFTGVDATFKIFNARVDAPTGKVFDFSDVVSPGSNIVNIIDVQIDSCVSIGDFDGLAGLVMSTVNVPSTNDGVAMAGSNWLVQSFIKLGFFSSSATFTGIDLGTSVSPNIEIANLFFSAPAGAIGVSGAANSANVATGSIATFRDSSFVSGMTEISGISPNDIRWAFSLNGGIPDTQPDAMVSLNNNVTETAITVQSTAVKVAGTWVVERTSLFTADTTGRVTYIAERPLTSPVDIVTTISSVSGSNKDIEVFLALNGTVIANSGKTNRVSQNDPKEITVIWQLTLNQNDFLEVFAANDTDTVNLVVSDAILRAR